jgi:arabinofuranosyltransferase
VFVVGLMGPYFPPLLSNANYAANRDSDTRIERDGITDERRYYYGLTGLLRKRPSPIPHVWGEEGWTAAHIDEETVAVRGTVGFFGFFAGPTLHIIDFYALADPLLSRLPAERPWRIGHFARQVPDGYVESVEWGENSIEDPHLAEFYDHLKTITSDPIWSWRRIRTIARMNAGGYDELLKAYSMRNAEFAFRNVMTR